VFRGHGEICNYWTRNSERQKNLTINWSVVAVEQQLVRVKFVASFFDIEERQQNRIDGIMNLILTGRNTILSLAEEYRKETE